MSDENVRRMIEEATKQAMTQSFTEAGQKYLQAADVMERKSEYREAENLRVQAAENFVKAAEKYRSSKSFKIAALNMCLAGDTYSDLAQVERALASYERAAEDLYDASTEHLMWGEDAETKKGTALAVAASMLYLMIGKEDIAFSKAKTFASENASKLRFPGVVRLSQIPQMLQSAIEQMDIQAFSEAETSAVTELKTALAGAGAQEFSGYVDKGIEMVREILRGKLKVPKITSYLDLPVDMTFSEEFPLKVIIENKGDGPARNLTAEWYLDEGLTHVSGEKKVTIPEFPPGTSQTLDLVAKASEELMGVKEYSILVRGTYTDDLRTEYSLHAGPGTLILKDYKETEKLIQDIDVTEGRVGILMQSLEQSELETDAFKPLIEQLSSTLSTARSDITEKELEKAKSRIAVVNEFIDSYDSIIGDDSLSQKLLAERKRAKKEHTLGFIGPIEKGILDSIESAHSQIDSQKADALAEFDKAGEGRSRVSDAISKIKKEIDDLVHELDGIYKEMPKASDTEDPTLAAKRTKLRTAVDALKTKMQSTSQEVLAITRDGALAPKDKPEIPPKISLAKDTLDSLKDEVSNVFSKKKSELA